MARENHIQDTSGLEEFHETDQTAVIYTRGPRIDKGTNDAKKDAGEKGCRVFYRNENYYEHASRDERVLPVDFCYTDDPGITKEYEQAGIEVIQLAPKAKPKKVETEEDRLRKRVAELEAAQKPTSTSKQGANA